MILIHSQRPARVQISPFLYARLHTRLLRGRVISDGDTPNSRHVAVVNQTFAHKFFPNRDPIGQHFGLGDASHSGDYEIVGVVEDAKYQNARVPAYPTAFMSLLQTPAEGVVRYKSLLPKGFIRLRIEPERVAKEFGREEFSAKGWWPPGSASGFAPKQSEGLES
jgi:hypothetical protein